MLEFLRKHKMVVLGAMVLVFVGLVFIERNGGGGALPGRGPVLATVGDTSYSVKDEQLMGDASIQVAYSLPSIFPTVQLLMTGDNGGTTNLMVNRALIREEAKRLGISAGKDTVDLYIQQMPEFKNATTGDFDVELYRKAIGLRHKGPQNREREDILRSIIADTICFEQLQNIISNNLRPNEAFIISYAKSLLQAISVRLAVFNKEAFIPKSDPGETEIKAFWEKRKGNYNSEEERIITLYTFTPNKDKESKAGDKKLPAGTSEVFNAVEDFWVSLYKNSSKDLDQKLKTMADNSKILSFQRQQFPLSSLSNAAKELSATLNPLSGPKQATLIETAFAINKAPSLDSYNEHAQNKTLDQIASNEQISETCVRNDGSVSLIRVDAIKPVGPLSYEQAKEQAKKDLISEMADEAMAKAANALHKTLLESKSLTADFEKIAQAAGATIKNYGPYNGSNLPEGFAAAASVYAATKKINPGQITPTLISEDEAIIAELVRRSLEVSPEMGAEEARVQGILMGYNAQDIINDWLQSSMKRYKVKVTPRASSSQEQPEQP